MRWLQLVRWKNLIIILLTQFAVWWCVILPVKDHEPYARLLLTPLNFWCVSVSTMLIAAAGYIINDYFDVRIDAINRPEKFLLGNSITRRTAILLHAFFNAIALSLAGYVALKGGHPEWLLFQLGCIGLLWLYNSHLKRQFMIGNIVVAIMTALSIIVLIVFEPWLQSNLTDQMYPETSLDYLLIPPALLIFMFSGFAFLLTWMREIVKDMEDIQGDSAEQCATMPIKWGLRKASFFTIALGVFTVMALVIAAFYFYATGNIFHQYYTILMLIMPMVVWIGFLMNYATSAHYARMSMGLKIIMVLGIGLLLVNKIVEWTRSF